MANLVDSGARRQFDSGAVRDVAEGKGRCDLLPLDVVSYVLYGDDENAISYINSYVRTGDWTWLVQAITFFCAARDWDIATAVLEVSKHYEDGARKYAERNWEQGIPLHCYIDSAVRHYIKWMRGDNDEPHDRAVLWNLMCAIWTQIHHPDLIDLPFAASAGQTEQAEGDEGTASHA